MSEVPFGNAYDECARCGSWRYTHATSDAAKGCPGFKEEGPPRKDSRRRYDEAQAKQVAALNDALTAEAARLIAEVDRLRGLLREAYRELSTIEAITVSPSDTDGLIDLCRRLGEAIKKEGI